MGAQIKTGLTLSGLLVEVVRIVVGPGTGELVRIGPIIGLLHLPEAPVDHPFRHLQTA